MALVEMGTSLWFLQKDADESSVNKTRIWLLSTFAPPAHTKMTTWPSNNSLGGR